MGWTTLNGTMNPGDTFTWWYGYDIPFFFWNDFTKGGSDAGAQNAMANPLNPEVTIVTVSQRKQRTSDGKVRYWVEFTNISQFPTTFNIQIGGLT
jgi:hypothetical protein